VQFVTRPPGLSRFPPLLQSWESALGPDDLRCTAATAEALGYDALTVGDHFVMARDDVPVMGAHWLHAQSTIGFLLGATQRLRVVVSVIALPLHDPLEMAKAIATLDVLSDGRLEVGFGVGFLARQFELVGVPFAERGARTDEYLGVMKELWTSDEPAFHGRFVSFDGLAFEPKPVQRPHPPLWIGGDSRAALRRAAREGTGWRGMATTLDQLPDRLDYLRRRLDAGSRHDLGISIPLGQLSVDAHGRPLVGERAGDPHAPRDADRLLERLDRMHRLGVTATTLPTPVASSFRHYLDELAWFSESVMEPFRRATGSCPIDERLLEPDRSEPDNQKELRS
jgi:probable F420-dependent oxidoreductase